MKPLNIFDSTGNAKSGWNNTVKLTDAGISSLKDKAAKTTNALNAVPSPFARMHIFETAFKLVAKDISENKDNTSKVYKDLVSDCLDALELIFNANYHNSQGDGIEFINWNVNDLLPFKEGTVGQKNFFKTINLYLEQDFDLSAHQISIIKYKGLVIAGSSPFSILFTSPNIDKSQGKFRSEEYEQLFDLINPSTKLPYFKKYVPFSKRSKEFKAYIFSFFDENPQKKTEMLHFWRYLTAEGILSASNFPTLNLKLIPSLNGGQIQVKGILLKMNADEGATDIFQDHILKVGYKINNSKYRTPKFKNDDDDRDFDFLIPIKASFLKNLDLTHISEHLSYEMIGKESVKVTYDNGSLVKTKLFYNSGGGKSDGTIIDPSKDSQYNFTIGISPFYKIVNKNGGPNIQFNDYYKVCFAIDAGQYELLKTEKFNLIFYKKTESGVDVISEEGTHFNAERFVRRGFESPSTISSIYYQINNTTFDFIKINLQPTVDKKELSGLIIPKWVEKEIGEKQVDFSVDFGTTNTFVAYTDDVTHTSVPKAFDITLDDMQMVMLQKTELPKDGRSATYMLTKGISTSNLVSHIFYNEFVPPLLIPSEKDSPFKMPFRTAVFEKKNLKGFKIFDDINIHFAYQKTLIDANDTSFQQIVSNLKWDITDTKVTGARERVNSYIHQLCLMFRHKILLSDGDPSKTTVNWFIPQSLSEAARSAYNEIWTYNVRNVLKSNKPPKMVLEAEAPYYYLKRSGQVSSTESVLSIDIGGGSTDAMLFMNNIPRIGTSFNFAGNALWSNGYNQFEKGGRDNGFYQSLNEKLADEIANSDDNIRFSKNDYLNRPTDEIINFWLANSEKLKVIDYLKDPRFKIVYLVHFASIIYHLGQLLKANNYKAPSRIIFSGNGSKYIDFIGDEKILAKISSYIMNKVFNDVAEEIKIILPPSNRKEATCFGGIFKDSDVEFASKSYIGTTLDFVGVSSSRTYADVENNLLNIKLSIKDNVKSLFKILEGLNEVIPFKTSLNIDLNISTLSNYFEGKLEEYFDKGYGIRKEKIAFGEKVSDSLFFYPLIGIIFDLSKIDMEKIEEFAPKKTFYISEPGEENVFNVKGLSEDKSFTSIYKILIPINNPNEATFEIIQEKSVYQRAYSAKDHLLKPVCSNINLPPSTDINIRMLNKGRLRKDGNNWIVTERLQIEYL